MTEVSSIGRQVPFPDLAGPTLLVIGYAGRDEASVRHHIEELAAFGIAPPPRVPMVHPLPAGLLTADPVLPAAGARTSGEVEPVLVRAAGRWYPALGSDHTDRELEAVDVRESEAACPKPVSGSALRLDVDPASGALDAAWDAIESSSAIDGIPYQRCSLAVLRMPSDLIRQASGGDPGGDLVVFGGTVPLLAGSFHFGRTFSATMTGPGWALGLDHTLAEPGN